MVLQEEPAHLHFLYPQPEADEGVLILMATHSAAVQVGGLHSSTAHQMELEVQERVGKVTMAGALFLGVTEANTPARVAVVKLRRGQHRAVKVPLQVREVLVFL